MRKSLLFIGVGFLLVSVQGSAYGFWIWSPKTSKFTNPKKVSKQTPAEQLAWALSFYEAGDHGRVVQEMKNLVRQYPRSHEAAEAQFYAGRSLEALEDYDGAFKAYEEVIKKYPNSARIQEVIEREYQIANLYYSGKKRKIAGLELLPSYQKAIEIYKQVVDHAPYGPYAELALYKMGECYRKTGEYGEAQKTFERLMKDYPSTELKDDAKYQIALTTFKMSRPSSYDAQSTDAALEQFTRFIEEHPGSELVEESQEVIRDLKERKAEKALEIAEFYDGQGKWSAAAVYYNKVIEEHPESASAKEALEKLTVLKKREETEKK